MNNLNKILAKAMCEQMEYSLIFDSSDGMAIDMISGDPGDDEDDQDDDNVKVLHGKTVNEEIALFKKPKYNTKLNNLEVEKVFNIIKPEINNIISDYNKSDMIKDKLSKYLNKYIKKLGSEELEGSLKDYKEKGKLPKFNTVNNIEFEFINNKNYLYLTVLDTDQYVREALSYFVRDISNQFKKTTKASKYILDINTGDNDEGTIYILLNETTIRTDIQGGIL